MFYMTLGDGATKKGTKLVLILLTVRSLLYKKTNSTKLVLFYSYTV